MYKLDFKLFCWTFIFIKTKYANISSLLIFVYLLTCETTTQIENTSSEDSFLPLLSQYLHFSLFPEGNHYFDFYLHWLILPVLVLPINRTVCFVSVA